MSTGINFSRKVKNNSKAQNEMVYKADLNKQFYVNYRILTFLFEKVSQLQGKFIKLTKPLLVQR